MSLVPWILAGALASALVGALRSDVQGKLPPERAATCCELDVDGLGLTSDQLAAVKEACADSGRTLKTLANEEADLRRRLDTALEASAVDERALRELGQRLSTVRGQRLAASLDCVLGVRRVLSAEQLRELCARCGCSPVE